MSRLTLSMTIFLAVIGLSDAVNWGHGYLDLLALGLWYYAALNTFGRQVWNRIWIVCLAVSILIAIIAVIQIFFMPRSRGVFVSPNFLAGYASLHLFLALFYFRETATPNRWFSLGSIAANLVSLVLAQGRGAFVATAAGLLAVFGRRYPYRSIAGAAAFIGAALYQYSTRMSGVQEPRWGLWRLGLNIAAQRPVLGWGQNAIVLWPLGWGHFYSAPIEWMIAGGVIGFGAGAWMIYEGMNASRNHPALMALIVAWITNGLFIFDTAATSIPLFTVLAFLASEQRREKLITRPVNHDQPLLHRGV